MESLQGPSLPEPPPPCSHREKETVLSPGSQELAPGPLSLPPQAGVPLLMGACPWGAGLSSPLTQAWRRAENRGTKVGAGGR